MSAAPPAVKEDPEAAPPSQLAAKAPAKKGRAILVNPGGDAVQLGDVGHREHAVIFRDGVAVDLHDTGAMSKWYVLDALGPRRMAWDVLMLFIILYQVVIIPVEIGFVRPSYSLAEPYNGWWVVEFIVGCFFLIDLVLNCITSRLGTDGVHHWSPRRIARLYFLQVPFHGVLDLLALAPFVLLWAELLVGADSAIGGPVSATQILRFSRAGRVARYCRIVGLVRLVRIDRLHHIVGSMLKRYIFFGRYSAAVSGILYVIGMFAIVMHLASCLFAWVCTDFEAQVRDGAGPYSDPLVETTLWDKYSFAVFWCVITLSGGSPPTAPSSYDEMWFWTVISFLFVICSNISIGMLCAVVDKFNEAETELYDNLQVAMKYISRHQLSPLLKGRVLSAVRAAHEAKEREGAFEEAIEPLLSEDLLARIKGAIYHKAMAKFPPFKGMPRHVVGKLAAEGSVRTFVANDYIFREGEEAKSMFVVLKGKAAIRAPAKNAFLPEVAPGWWLDEGAILGSEGGARPYSCLALGPCKVLEITREAYNEAKEASGLRDRGIATGGGAAVANRVCPVCMDGHDVLDCEVLCPEVFDEDDEAGLHHQHPVAGCGTLRDVSRRARIHAVPLPAAPAISKEGGDAVAQLVAAVGEMTKEVRGLSGRLAALERRCDGGLGDLGGRLEKLQAQVTGAAKAS